MVSSAQKWQSSMTCELKTTALLFCENRGNPKNVSTGLRVCANDCLFVYPPPTKKNLDWKKSNQHAFKMEIISH